MIFFIFLFAGLLYVNFFFFIFYVDKWVKLYFCSLRSSWSVYGLKCALNLIIDGFLWKRPFFQRMSVIIFLYYFYMYGWVACNPKQFWIHYNEFLFYFSFKSNCFSWYPFFNIIAVIFCNNLFWQITSLTWWLIVFLSFFLWIMLESDG